MSFVPRTDDVTLWALLGTLVAALTGLELWSRRERLNSGQGETGAANPGGESPSGAPDDDRCLRLPE